MHATALTRRRLQGAIPLVAGDADTYYRRLERLNSEICDDLKFDLWLKVGWLYL